MATLPKLPERSPEWSAEAMAMAAQAKVLSGSKLEQLVVRLQRHSGRPKEACWRFIIQYGIKGQQDHRRWTESEFEIVREELVKRSIEEVAKKVNRTPKAIRNMLKRNHLSLREIRCDLFSVESLASALRVRKAEVVFWIEQGWLQASIVQPRQAEILRHHARSADEPLQAPSCRCLEARHSESGPLRGVRSVLLFPETHGWRTTARCPAGQARTGRICSSRRRRDVRR